MNEWTGRWTRISLGACVLARTLIGLGLRGVPGRNAPEPADPGPAAREAELPLLGEQPQGAGWVFGRVVGASRALPDCGGR